MRSGDTSVWGLELLVYEALTVACLAALELLVNEALSSSVCVYAGLSY